MTMSGSISSLESPAGSFIVTCGLVGPKNAEEVQCLGNIRPDDNVQIQYELRYNKDGTHTIKPTLKSAYDPPTDESHVALRQKFTVTSDMNSNAEQLKRHTHVDFEEASDFPQTEEGEAIHSARRRLTDTNNILDVFFVYTPEAVAQLGGETAMKMACDLSVEESNVVFENSNIGLRMRSVGSMGVLDNSFVEPDDMYELLELATSYSGGCEIVAVLHIEDIAHKIHWQIFVNVLF